MQPNLPTPPEQADPFVKIAWIDWISAYWVPTITSQDRVLFIMVHQPGTPSWRAQRPKQKAVDPLTTEYIEGEDGFTYIERRNPSTGELYLEPIYMLRTGGL